MYIYTYICSDCTCVCVWGKILIYDITIDYVSLYHYNFVVNDGINMFLAIVIRCN